MQNMISEKKTKGIYWSFFTLLFVLIWVKNTILPFVLRVMQGIPLISIIAEPIIVATFVFLIVLSLLRISGSIRVGDVAFYVFACVAILLTTVLVEENTEFLQKDLWRILGLTIPMYFVGVSFRHCEIKRILYVVSLLSVLAMTAYQVYLHASGRVMLDDNMNAAYNILPSVMYISYTAFKNNKLSNWVAAVISIATMLIYGTRGPILVIVVYFCIKIMSTIFKKGSTKIKYAFFVVSAIFVALLLNGKIFTKFIQFLAGIFERFGFSSRIFDLFLEGNILDDNGRAALIESVVSAIKERPILGYGIMGDRVIAGNYVHNLFLEVWCHFGVIVGTVLLIWLIFTVIRALRIEKDGFLLMLVCMVFTKLMLSSSYLYEANLFFLMGVAVSTIRNERETRAETVI